MKKIKVLENEYEIIIDNQLSFNLADVEKIITEYFEPYDYILGDYSYGKLRLKGFYDNMNKMVNSVNNFNDVDNYIKCFCAYNCKYFILKKIKNDKLS